MSVCRACAIGKLVSMLVFCHTAGFCLTGNVIEVFGGRTQGCSYRFWGPSRIEVRVNMEFLPALSLFKAVRPALP